MEFIVVSGLSGSGKSRGVDALEDIGFFCVDNMPPSLIVKFRDMCIDEGIEKFAVVCDTRGRDLFNGLSETLSNFRKDGLDYKLLFFDCSNDVLMNRFKETRRKHPLTDECGGSIEKAILKERRLLEPVREYADVVIDTSHISPSKLKEIINETFVGDSVKAMNIHCISFGFKYGPATEADMVFDVRCLPNPFYIPALRHLTGCDHEVFDYVMEKPESKEYARRLFDLLDYLVPLYSNEGKSQLTLAFGCTGGKHRSVTFAELCSKHFAEKGFNVTVIHRDTDKT